MGIDMMKTTHIVTLSFDDGFRRSSIRTAEIYEKYGLSACINVIATGDRETFVAPDRWHADFKRGDFRLWNALQARGHEIMPHGYRHANKALLPLAESQKLIMDCLAVFQAELAGFDPLRSVFNFPFNASTPELDAWLPTVVGAYRTGGSGINPMPFPGMCRLTTEGFGPGNSEAHLDAQIEKLLALPSGWLIYNTHGLDDEGWGPIGSDYLDDLLARLTSLESVALLPVTKVLAAAV